MRAIVQRGVEARVTVGDEEVVTTARRGPVPVATGRFQAHMAVALVNDGPVTLLLDTAES